MNRKNTEEVTGLLQGVYRAWKLENPQTILELFWVPGIL